MNQEKTTAINKAMNSNNYFRKMINNLYFTSEYGYYDVKRDVKWAKKASADDDTSQLIDAKHCAEKTLVFLKTFLTKSDSFTCVEDFSRVEIGELCYNIQLIKDDRIENLSHSICVNISNLIPFFHLHILELKRNEENFSKWRGLPVRVKKLENSVYLKEVLAIKKYLTNDLQLQEFPEELLNRRANGIYTKDIENFTYYNAFFQREFDTR